MNRIRFWSAVALGSVLVASGGGWWVAGGLRTVHWSGHAAVVSAATAADRKVIYYRDPSGAPIWSATPKKDQNGRDFLPVYDDEDASFDTPAKKAEPAAASSSRKILYYRNPMGLPDTSPVPKKDGMGMDYIPVYEGEDSDEGSSVKISLDRVQRSGVRSDKVEKHVLAQPIRAVGAVAIDESRLVSVTLRADGYIEDLFVNTTGQEVRAGQPLFRVYSSQIQQAQIDLNVAVASARSAAPAEAERMLSGAMQRLRNLAVPEERISEVRRTGANPRTIDWPAPASGVVITKRVINGQRVAAGEELYRIADLSTVWVIADVAEADLAMIRPGTRTLVTFRAYPTEPVEGKVTLIYPEIKPETRTARVRIEVANPDSRLKADMYADVVFQPGLGGAPVLAVPSSAVIDSGTEQVVLVAKGEGRFEPRRVSLGRRSEGYREVLGGIAEGEEVVTAATFLIDSESNLRAALKTFTRQESAK